MERRDTAFRKDKQQINENFPEFIGVKRLGEKSGRPSGMKAETFHLAPKWPSTLCD
jgi:hypothetical protein